MKKNLVAGLVLALGTVFSAGADDVVTSFDYQASQARLLDVTPRSEPMIWMWTWRSWESVSARP